MKIISFAVFAAAALLTACGTDSANSSIENSTADVSAQQAGNIVSANTVSANNGTITYNVYLTPASEKDDEGIGEFVADFNREAFVDSIFSAIFYHQAVVTDIDGNRLSIDDIKTREVEEPEKYGRDKIAGIQFTEEWAFDPATAQMHKKVKSMLIGYDVVVDGERFALRPGFVIKY